MKKVLQSMLFAGTLLVGANANAQIPDYGVYPGGLTLTDFFSNTHDIDADLDAGKPVILDLFAVWCNPCWNYHQAGTLESVYNSIGDGGTGAAKIYAVEADPSTPESSLDGGGNSVGDWVTGTLYPMINNDNVASTFNLEYYPTLVLVCPDRSVTEVGQASSAQWIAAVNACPGLASNTNDPRVVSNETTDNITLCGSGTASTDIKVGVQNYSTSAINGSYNIEATIGATVIASTTATLNLQPYAATEVNLGSASLSLGNNNITVTITTTNDNTSNDAIAVPVTVEQAVDMGTGDITINATFDGYGSEVGYGFASGTVQETDPFAAYPMFNGGSYPGQIDFKNIGTWTNSSTGFSEDYFGLATGCYHLYMFDNYGDGLTNGSNGALSLVSGSTTENLSVDYGSGTWFTFEVTSAGGQVGVEESSSLEFAKVFPNPATDLTTLQFYLNDASNVTIELFNTMGQIVYSDNMGEVNGLQTVEIETSNLEAGMYLINMNVDGKILTKRVSVIK